MSAVIKSRQGSGVFSFLPVIRITLPVLLVFVTAAGSRAPDWGFSTSLVKKRATPFKRSTTREVLVIVLLKEANLYEYFLCSKSP